MQLLLKDIEWMAWSVKHKKKRELQVSLPLNKGLHTFNQHSVQYIASPREKHEQKTCCASGQIYIGSSLYSFYQGMVRTMKMSFYIRKI